jgi:hypothetical protein
MSLLVLAAGMPRTGTTSLKTALQQLGFGPCMHMEDLFQDGWRTDMWQQIFLHGQTDFSTLFSGYQSTTDFPACLLYDRLLMEFPDLKIIVNYRDPNTWYESMLRTVYPAAMQIETQSDRLKEKARSVPGFEAVVKGLRLVHTHLLQGYFAGNFLDEESTKARYREHYHRLNDVLPGAQFINYGVEQGWDPLCTFLGVPMPGGAFPHKNTRANFEAQIGNMLDTGSKPGIS